MKLSTPVKNARLQVLADLIDNSGGGTLTLYTAPQPTTPDDTLNDQQALVAIPCAVPFASSISDGQMVLTPLAETMATTGGTPTWARLTNTDGAVLADLTVGTDITLGSDQIYPGILVRASAAGIAE